MYVSYDFTYVIPSAPNITREHPLLSKKITYLHMESRKVTFWISNHNHVITLQHELKQLPVGRNKKFILVSWNEGLVFEQVKGITSCIWWEQQLLWSSVTHLMWSPWVEAYVKVFSWRRWPHSCFAVNSVDFDIQ